MEKLTIEKTEAVKFYNAASEDTKEVLREMFGAETFAFDWRGITSYEKACEVLGIQPQHVCLDGQPRPQYLKMADAVQQLLTICEAINNGEGWYDEDGWGYYPVFVLYSKEEMAEINEAERKRRGIHQLLAAANAAYAENAGVRCAYTSYRGAATYANCGFPLCLNSEEKAEFVGKQFFELCCTCYGITPKMD